MSFFGKRKNLVVLSLIVAVSVLFIVLYSVPKQGNGWMANAVHTAVMPIQKGISTCTNGVRGFFSFVSNAKQYQAENDKLKSEINAYKMSSRSVEEYQAENDRLKKLLKLQEDTPNYQTVASSVISRDSTNWYNVFTIDKGKKDGIVVNDVVMVSEGLVGHVKEVGHNWAKVVSIIDETSSVGGYVERVNEVAICEGNANYAKDGKCRLTHIPVDSQMAVGDMIKTSGLSDIYPRGILIGSVEKIYTDASTSSKYAVVQPSVDFSRIQEVLVIKNTQQEGSGD